MEDGEVQVLSGRRASSTLQGGPSPAEGGGSRVAGGNPSPVQGRTSWMLVSRDRGETAPPRVSPTVLSFCVSAAASEIAGGTRGSHSRKPEKVLGQKEQGEGAWQARLRCLSPGECADQGQTPAPLP